MFNYFNQSIARKFFLAMIVIFILAFLGIMALLVANHYVRGNIISERIELTEKQRNIEDIENHFTKMLFHARGYYALKFQSEYDQVSSEKEQLLSALQAFQQQKLSSKEFLFLNEINEFINYFEEEVFPTASRFVETDNYEGLRTYSASGATDSVNSILYYTRSFSDSNNQHLAYLNDQLVRLYNLFNLLFVAYIFVMMVLLALAIKKVTKEIGKPLIELTQASKQLAKGRDVKLDQLKRSDELGTLSRSFEQMVKSIQGKEEELTAQNEELKMQQEALEFQQEQLEKSLLELNNLNKAVNKSAIVVITDKLGKITYANERFCEITKLLQDDILGQDHRMISSGYHTQEFFGHLWNTIMKGSVWSGEIKNKAKDRSFYWVDTTIVPYLDDEGEPYQFISISFDITKIKLVEEQLVYSLEETQQTKDTLYKHNQLNHALSITLDKNELLTNIIKHISLIYEFDKSLITLVHSTDVVASIGISDNEVARFLENLHESMLVRTKQTEDIHIVTRLAKDNERGIASEEVECYDLYAPIFSSDGELISFIIATRIGRSFSADEVHEIKGILKRISLSLEKIYLYEETENRRQLNQDIIDNVNEGIAFVDSKGSIIQCNKKIYELFHVSDKEDLSNSLFEQWTDRLLTNVVGGEGLKRFFERAIFEEQAEDVTYRYELNKPIKRIVDVYATQIYRHSRHLGALIVYRDITSEYEVDQMKSELVSTVSHELRTPLSSVLGFTELMLTKELKPERKKKYLQTIHKEASRLTNLINDFLDLQRMESGKQTYEMKHVNIVSIAENVLKTFKATKPTHQYQLECEKSSISVLGDEEKIIQLFTNLISNGVKFSPDGGLIKVGLVKEADKVSVSISDQGLGIPEEEVSKLFQKFYRIDNTDRRKIGGTGLGLAICKQIVLAHNGEIGVTSQLGKGSTFMFTLPLNEMVTRNEQNDSKNKTGVATLVIIEDDYSLSMLLSDELQGHGFLVKQFEEGKKAIESIKEVPPELIIIDIMLKEGMDGWEIINELKKSDDTKNIPIIISSALDEKEKSNSIGIDHYLTKPYPPRQLTEVVLELLTKGGSKGEILIPIE